MDNELPRQELVKCVVVGDSAVGKTRLIVARATNQAMTRSQLFQTHIPSVWAIDQYRMCQEVLENSWETIDGVSVSLRLWDTFGDHEKDRQFAYGRADVVLLCFSIADAVSLKNVKKKWLPEIRHFCPRAPIIMCGCKNDLRYADLEALKKERGPVSHQCSRHRAFDPEGILPPKEGRNIAKESNCVYYETSSYTLYGVQEVFDNVVRAALIYRRQHRFWQSNLKKVQKPLLQAPYLPGCPREPSIHIPDSTYASDISFLLKEPACADVIFTAHGELICAHKVCLLAASPIFSELFLDDEKEIELSKQSSLSVNNSSNENQSQAKDILQPHHHNVPHQSPRSESPMCCHSPTPDRSQSPECNHENICPSPPLGLHPNFNTLLAEDQCLSISPNGNTCLFSGSAQHKNCSKAKPAMSSSPSHHQQTSTPTRFRSSSPSIRSSPLQQINTPTVPANLQCLPTKTLNHQAFDSIHLQQVTDNLGGRTIQRHIVVLNPKITAEAFRAVLEFLYTGSLDIKVYSSLSDIITAASLLDLSDLVAFVANVKNQEVFLNADLVDNFLHKRKERFAKLFANQGLLSDLVINVEDGQVKSHKCLVMVRCDPMLAMLSGNFKESSSEVSMKTFKKSTFELFLEYLYTDQCHIETNSDALALLELANFLCLPHLVALCEKSVVHELQSSMETQEVLDEAVVGVLQIAKLHNAHQLHSWCIHYMTIRYIDVQKGRPKLFKELAPEYRKQIERQRWPPAYYLDEAAYFEKCLAELKKGNDIRTKKHKWCLR
ncbi:rho-related BTB domain-containing protein 1-like [Lytechinus variegatus]|uniref:rho-related BTB domain-containing protein 1-like n=1 Tax=Lytechinus variegatus TaxID=7654 RepID=UPI001BB26BB1|nr:rho-related BTB domain-containing protein 1-like [Lytechinus variegatus]